MNTCRNTSVSGYTREIRITFELFVFTAIVWFMLGADMFGIFLEHIEKKNDFAAVMQATFMAIIAFMQFSVLVYMLARLGQLYRHRSHRVPHAKELMKLYKENSPTLKVLVPSYKEDIGVVRKTLLSAALLDYPNKSVVLLIDDPHASDNELDQQELEQSRAMVQRLGQQLASYAQPFQEAWRVFENNRQASFDITKACHQLVELYEKAATCLEVLRDNTPNLTHEDVWFIDENLDKPAKAFRQQAAALRTVTLKKNTSKKMPDRADVAQQYFRLSRLFSVEVSAFERKQYINLSHEPNKAMNLNSYIGLMGKSYSVATRHDGKHIIVQKDGEGSHAVSDAEFIITLDADSLLSSDYALKLIAVMTKAGSERVAVVQTPYNAFPGASKAIERMAGATTDIQYLVHQGFTQFNATFWVGANALLRKQALEDIALSDEERGFPITRYIQDRTVIEDTESSVDLVARDWSLFNYPERLAFSSTPPDFGSLLIQRRRWANGGLIIFPKFVRYITRLSSVPHRFGHALMGIHYLTSLAVMNIGILVLLWLPLEEPMRSPWLPLAMLPYLILYTRDLLQSGYQKRDLLGVYALSLLLVPVHLGGVFKSISQIITGKRTPFGRTPKIADRTAVPLLYLTATFGFLAYCVITLTTDIEQARWLHALFAATNGGFLAYGIYKFMGLVESFEDMKLGVLSVLPISKAAQQQSSQLMTEPDTRSLDQDQ